MLLNQIGGESRFLEPAANYRKQEGFFDIEMPFEKQFEGADSLRPEAKCLLHGRSVTQPTVDKDAESECIVVLQRQRN